MNINHIVSYRQTGSERFSQKGMFKTSIKHPHPLNRVMSLSRTISMDSLMSRRQECVRPLRIPNYQTRHGTTQPEYQNYLL
ncbi:Hypothetical protein FKW44_006154 [Caligus rogercresseyi]|uniref:Uncharacterized protein n=1 Tax=Caligus rogercresseyi TaxID=217165 RepID=A0A7T8KCY8_CALRO|nr:Hypothetical protein FKW44_006154 [Caligus rogercresseyi]